MALPRGCCNLRGVFSLDELACVIVAWQHCRAMTASLGLGNGQKEHRLPASPWTGPQTPPVLPWNSSCHFRNGCQQVLVICGLQGRSLNPGEYPRHQYWSASQCLPDSYYRISHSPNSWTHFPTAPHPPPQANHVFETLNCLIVRGKHSMFPTLNRNISYKVSAVH